MSLYNIINRVDPVTFFILPMLGRHPDEYPRFRDCFVKDDEHPEYDDHIHVYTRTGGGNRERYESENDAMRKMETFVTDYDDGFDSTYASWVFGVPEKWAKDFGKIQSGEIGDLSQEYQSELRRVYPRLDSKFDELFAKA
jgi:hypothetical protein